MRDIDDIPESELGVERDRLVDAKIEASHAVQRLERLHVDLDTLADADDLPQQFVDEVRQAQSYVNTALNRAKSLEGAYHNRLREVEKRLND